MNFAVFFISLIFTYDIPKSYANSSKVPGCSGCVYFGSITEWCYEKGLKSIPITDMPEECTSFFYLNIMANENFNIVEGNFIPNNADYINGMIDSGKPSFLYYDHLDFKTFSDAISSNTQDGGVNAKKEMVNLKGYLKQYPKLSGIVIQGITPMPNSTIPANFTANFKIYLDEMKNTFPNFGIGLELYGPLMIDHYSKPPSKPEWLIFDDLDPCIDFYVLNVYRMNDCTDKFKVGGTNLISGNAKYTFDKIVEYAAKAGIPKEKRYFLIRLSPRTHNLHLTLCDVNNAKLCEAPSLDDYCSDNIKTYYEKGKFVKENAAGFIGLNVDFADDPYGCCKCKTSFPAFHSILAGLKGAPAPESCPLLDKP